MEYLFISYSWNCFEKRLKYVSVLCYSQRMNKISSPFDRSDGHNMTTSLTRHLFLHTQHYIYLYVHFYELVCCTRCGTNSFPFRNKIVHLYSRQADVFFCFFFRIFEFLDESIRCIIQLLLSSYFKQHHVIAVSIRVVGAYTRKYKSYMHTRCVRLSQEYIRFPRLLVYIDDIKLFLYRRVESWNWCAAIRNAGVHHHLVSRRGCVSPFQISSHPAFNWNLCLVHDRRTQNELILLLGPIHHENRHLLVYIHKSYTIPIHLIFYLLYEILSFSLSLTVSLRCNTFDVFTKYS